MRYLREINGQEEPQTLVYANLLDKSLTYGTELIVRLHQHDSIEFSDQLEMYAIEQKIKPSDDRRLDWILKDGSMAIGFESKRGDALKPDQLQDELDELKTLSSSPVLVAITDHLRPPTDVLEKTRKGLSDEETLVWQSWHQVAHRVYSLSESSEELPPEHRPLLDILKDMFESENYEPRFEGIEIPEIDADDLAKREESLVSLISDVAVGLPDTPAWGSPDPQSYTSDSWSRLRKSHYYVWPNRITYRFIRESGKDNPGMQVKESAIELLVNLTADEFMAVLDINADMQHGNKRANHEAILENAESLVSICQEYDLQIWTTNNSWDQSSHPVKYHEYDEARKLLTDATKFGYSPNKRVIMGRSFQSASHSPQEFVEKLVETLMMVKQVFLDETQIFEDVFSVE